MITITKQCQPLFYGQYYYRGIRLEMLLSNLKKKKDKSLVFSLRHHTTVLHLTTFQHIGVTNDTCFVKSVYAVCQKYDLVDFLKGDKGTTVTVLVMHSLSQPLSNVLIG